MKEVVRVWIGNPIEQGKFNGTAFFIDTHILVTAKHVVIDGQKNVYDSIYISDTSEGGVFPIDEVVLCCQDIAILKVKKAFAIESLVLKEDITQGDKVNIIGFHDNHSSRKSYENRVVGYYNKEHIYELQNHLTNGLSGSPVLLNGAICGVAHAISRDRNITYITPISEICIDLSASKVKKSYKNSFLLWGLSTFLIGLFVYNTGSTTVKDNKTRITIPIETQKKVDCNTLIWQDNKAVENIKKVWLTDDNYERCEENKSSLACFDVSLGDTAYTYCSNLRLNGHTDWKLPSKKELFCVDDLEPFKYKPRRDKNNSTIYTWSSTVHKENVLHAISVTMGTKYKEIASKNRSLSVRCVRGIQ